METPNLQVKGREWMDSLLPGMPPLQLGPAHHLTRPMVSSLAKLCVHHMRLVRFPFLGLSVVTEA